MKSKILALLSPAKLMKENHISFTSPIQMPRFLKKAELINKSLRKLSKEELAEILEISAKLAEETANNISSWGLPFVEENTTHAILLFKGEVYRGLAAEEWNEQQIRSSEDYIRILSGKYGYLRPLDRIQPYRLMMGTYFSPDKKSKNLYEFWRNDITSELIKDLNPKDTLVNLASQEYFKVIDTSKINNAIVTCEFKERKGSKLSIVSTFAKQARGRMARFIVENKIHNPKDLQLFNLDRYRFSDEESKDNNYVFIR